MSAGDIIVALVVIAGVSFDFTNGFHDTANAMATTIAPGAIAWIRELRAADKKIALAASGERARAAVELAGVADLFDAIVNGPRNSGTAEKAVRELGIEPADAILVDVAPAGIHAGREAGFDLLIGVARNMGTPEDLRQAGADMVVADLQELLGFAKGLDR